MLFPVPHPYILSLAANWCSLVLLYRLSLYPNSCGHTVCIWEICVCLYVCLRVRICMCECMSMCVCSMCVCPWLCVYLHGGKVCVFCVFFQENNPFMIPDWNVNRNNRTHKHTSVSTSLEGSFWIPQFFGCKNNRKALSSSIRHEKLLFEMSLTVKNLPEMTDFLSCVCLSLSFLKNNSYLPRPGHLSDFF